MTSLIGDKTLAGQIARKYHDIQHVTRAALFAFAYLNLYKLHRDEEALNLTNEIVKLILIVVIYHDAGRLGEGEDLWDEVCAAFI